MRRHGRGRGRRSLLKSLRSFVNFEPFASGIGGERTVETNFNALDEELHNLCEAVNEWRGTSAAMTGVLQDAADRLALVIHDLKSRSMTPSDYVRDRTRLYRDSWVNPILDELEQKEKPSHA